MAKDRIGNIRFMGRDKDGIEVWSVQVQVGSNDSRTTLYERVHGSRREAELVAVRMKLALETAPQPVEELTLDEYYGFIFKPRHCVEAGLARATIMDYDKVYSKWVSPTHGSLKISKITRRDIAELIDGCSSKRNVKRLYRRIMNCAYRDHYAPNIIDFQGIDAPAKKRSAPARWSGKEILQAAEALRGREPVELYLMLASPGLRMEEALAVRPEDIFSIVEEGDSGSKERLVVNVRRAYTDCDGIKETKTPESVRCLPMISRFVPRAKELVSSLAPQIEAVGEDSFVIRYVSGWKRKRFDQYQDKLVEGTFEDAEKEAAAIDESRPRPAGTLRTRIYPLRSGFWRLMVPVGCSYGTARIYEEEAYFGTYDEARYHAYEVWKGRRLLSCTAAYLRGRWNAELKANGLRPVPPSFLRKSSESMMVAAKVPSTVVQKLHGHSTFTTDYEHYIDIDLEAIVDASNAVESHLEREASAARHTMRSASESLFDCGGERDGSPRGQNV